MRACAHKSACRARLCLLEEAEGLGPADRRDRVAADGRASWARAEFPSVAGIFPAGRDADLWADRGADLPDELTARRRRGENLGARQDGLLLGAGPSAEVEAAYRASVHWEQESHPGVGEPLALSRAAPRRGETLCWLEEPELAQAVVLAEGRWK